MSRKLVIQLLVLAGIVGVGALGVGIWQERQKAERQASAPASPEETREEVRPHAEQATGKPVAPAAGRTDDTAQAPAESSKSAANESPSDTAGTDMVPSFDVMRVEPDGSAVVAGRAGAGSIVALLSNGKVVGKGIANSTGEFAIVLDQPLDPGAHAVTLETQDRNGVPLKGSEQSLAVSVPEDRNSGEVLVMLNEPGAPSRLLQRPEGLERPQPATPRTDEQQVAATGQTDEPAPQTPGPAQPATDRADAGQTSATAAPASDPGPPATSTEVAAIAPSSPGKTSNGRGTTAVAGAADDAGTAGERSAGNEPAAATGRASQSADAGAPSGQPEPAPGQDAGAPGSGVSVDAVETENDKVFVAGAGTPGSDVRVYLDNKLVGETTTDEKGRWLMEAERKVEPGKVDVRADQITSTDGSVSARAEVTFEKAAPEAVALRPLDAAGSAGGGAGAEGAAGARQIPSVIIRSGDNLWTISQRRYGHGVRYTTIYQANKDQIRNPDLIYPGQVFMLPESDRNWPTGN